MSPEQGQGESGDERSDIYALGVILYECLTGQVPYEGDTSVAVLLKHISAPIPSLNPIRPTLPMAYDRIIARAMAKDPEERFQSAHEMWRALETLTVDETAPTLTVKEVGPGQAAAAEVEQASRAQATTVVESRRLLIPRRPLLLGAVLLGLIVLVTAGLFLIPRFTALSPAAQALAEGQQNLASGEAQLAVDSFSRALDIDPGNVQALLGRAQAREQLGQVSEAFADVESAIATAPEEATGYQERARLIVQYGLDDPIVALADFDHAIQLAPDSPRAHFLRGWAILNFPLIEGQPNPTAAVDDLNKAVALDPRNAEAQLTLAQALLGAGNPEEALTPANRAVELEPESALHWKRRAHIEFALGDFHAAQDDLTAAIEREADVNTLALLYAERAYLSFRLSAMPKAQADLAQALNLAPASDLARYVQMLLDPSLPRPEAAQLEAARDAAADEPLWQAILTDLLAAP
jgi:tetratricopeptide (TPR) repeat protein